MEPMYFGCWGEKGHYLWTRSRRPALEPETLPPELHAHKLDGVYAPRLPGKYAGDKGPEAAQGRATITHVAGWTVLAFWDRSVDDRGASNSAFVIPGELTFEQARDRAREAFPEVWRRFTFEVVPA